MIEFENHMKANQPYRDNNLSQIINQQTKQNFFDFINAYRVADVQERIRKNAGATVLELAMDSGFNSKSAFYSAFRKHTGQTPSQFKQNL